MSKTFSEMLIERGVYPGRRLYERVRPRGIYMLLPSMWREAKRMEQSVDFTYEILMNDYKRAVLKNQLGAKPSGGIRQ